jgi:uncharacterized damage-inducible protein DinB
MNLVEALQKEFDRRIFEESYSRIENCLGRLTEKQIWHQLNESSNSIGNLVLHLMGNVRQYICSGIGGYKDERHRDVEFKSSSKCTKDELMDKMEILQSDVTKVIEELDEAKLLKVYKVQGFEELGMSIVIHVIEHFSYHVGQIAVQTKLLRNEDLGFYAGLDLNKRSN